MRKPWKWLAIAVVVTLTATTGVALAATSFSDVADDHPQRSDIEYAVDRGWFLGYGDGTFKPDRAITPSQIVRVLNRAFPDGATRADLATFLRGGTERLAAVRSSRPPSSTRTSAGALVRLRVKPCGMWTAADRATARSAPAGYDWGPRDRDGDGRPCDS